MKIRKKLGGGYLLVLGMVLICSGAGFYGVNRLSNLLDFITGPAWDTADGAMEGTIGIEAEMLGISMLTSGQVDTETAQSLLDKGNEMAEEALGRMISAGLMSANEISQVKKQKQRFRQAKETLLKAYQQFSNADNKLHVHFNNFQNLMTQAEELGDTAVETLEQSPDMIITWNSGLSEKWAAADRGMESQIELLTRFYNYQRLVKLMDETKASEEKEVIQSLNSALADLKEKVAEIQAHPLFQQKTVDAGHYQGLSFSSAIANALKTHQANFELAVATFYDFRKANVRYNTLANEFLTTIEHIEEVADGKVEAQADTISSTKSFTYTLIALAMVMGVVSAIAVFFFTVRNIVSSIVEMSAASQKIADGDLAFNISKMNSNSNNDELVMLRQNMGRMIEGLRHTISEVSITANMLSTQAEELSSVAQETTQGVLQQQAQTTAVASAVTEMSASSKEVADNTVIAKDSANQAQDEAVSGQQVVQESIEAINALSSDVSSTAEIIARLSKDSEKINGVLDVIEGIAEQTNLLALNAAIEAARAGDHGRGFAVVADEVRTLAHRTQTSTKEIQQVISGLQERTQSATLAMEESQAKAAVSTERAALAGEALQNITQEIQAIAHHNLQIADAMSQQEQTTEEINGSVVEIESHSEQTVNASNQTAESSRELAHQAANLNDVISHFKI